MKQLRGVSGAPGSPRAGGQDDMVGFFCVGFFFSVFTSVAFSLFVRRDLLAFYKMTFVAHFFPS